MNEPAVHNQFCLYRIIGNNIPRFHGEHEAQTLLRFILQHEEDFLDCEKWFVLNRIVDPSAEKQIVRILETNHRNILRIPFLKEEYARVPSNSEDIPWRGTSLIVRRAMMKSARRTLLAHALYRNKINYVANSNGARNFALQHGRDRARWVLPFDGACFMPSHAWLEMAERIAAHPDAKYAVVPMARLNDNVSILNDDAPCVADEEPQVAFRNDAQERFDPEVPYGRRSKVDLLWRLGVPGPWDLWTQHTWDFPRPSRSLEADSVITAGWVARLNAGGQHSRRPTRRVEAIVSFIEALDRRTLRQAPL